MLAFIYLFLLKDFRMKYLIMAAVILFISACTRKEKINIKKEKEIILQTDIDFSNMSKVKGMRLAFFEYMDTNAVLLRPGHFPLEGKDARRFIGDTDDSGFILTWSPQFVEISSSGDLGYTYGTWTSLPKKWLSDSVSRGTYVTIWKRQKLGGWKFILDTGNPGVAKRK
jgi:ketosteroid isomerase-like protein